MGSVTTITRSKFSIGELIQHQRFGYRGVIFDVDPVFQGTEEWYEAVAKSRPPKNEPWYHVLVGNALHTTYVAERHLKLDTLLKPIDHPMVDELFSGFEQGRYLKPRPQS